MRTVILTLLISFASNTWANNVVTGSAGGRLKGKLLLNSTVLGQCLS